MNLRDMGRFVEVPWKHYDDYISYIEFPLPFSLNTNGCPIDVCMRGVMSTSYWLSGVGGKLT